MESTMEPDDENRTDEKPTTQEDGDGVEMNPDRDEFEISVRRLELPVRPRGVLAE
jgi:hypothetical protein